MRPHDWVRTGRRNARGLATHRCRHCLMKCKGDGTLFGYAASLRDVDQPASMMDCDMSAVAAVLSS